MTVNFKNYKITSDPIEIGEKVPYLLNQELPELNYEIVHNPGKKVIKRLQSLLKKYPRNLQLHNYLMNAYYQLDRDKEAKEINNKALAINPNYLFALISKADFVLEDNEDLNEFPSIFTNNDFDLKSMYPERDIFHLTEFIGTQELAIKYYTKIQEYDKAFEHLNLIIEVDPDQQVLYSARKMYIEHQQNMTLAMERMRLEREQEITPVQNIQRIPFERPEFIISMSKELYTDDLVLSPEFIEKYLKHDRKSLIIDLENILKDSYSNFPSEDDIEIYNAAFHAYFILGELEAEESLSTVLNVLAQDEIYFDAVFGDYLTENGFQTIHSIGKNNIKRLFDFIVLPGLYTFSRTVVSDALSNIYISHPEKREEIISGYKTLLNTFINAEIKDNIIDSDFIGLIVCDFIDLNLKQFLPEIKQLYDKEYFFDNHAGNYEEIELELLIHSSELKDARKIKDLNEFYQSIRNFQENGWGGNIESILEKLSNTSNFFSREEKVGRNDPCPCGSGKKFKKCCLGKSIFE